MSTEEKRQGPVCLFVLGPPAVGKMTVGAAVERRTGLRLFHNHQTIDLVLPFFEFGSPPFFRLVGEFRRRIMEEVAESDLPGMVFTYVCAFNEQSEVAELEGYASIFRDRGGRAVFVELEAPQEVRVIRNEGADRLAAKPFKRNLETSRQNLLDLDARYTLNSAGEFDGRDDYLRIDNTHLSADEVADLVIKKFELPTVGLP